MGQRDLKIPRRLRIVGPVALIFAAFNGVPQSLAIHGPRRRLLGREDPLPFRLTEMPVILDLIGPLVDQLFTGVVGRSGDRTLAGASRNDTDLETV